MRTRIIDYQSSGLTMEALCTLSHYSHRSTSIELQSGFDPKLLHDVDQVLIWSCWPCLPSNVFFLPAVQPTYQVNRWTCWLLDGLSLSK